MKVVIALAVISVLTFVLDCVSAVTLLLLHIVRCVRLMLTVISMLAVMKVLPDRLVWIRNTECSVFRRLERLLKNFVMSLLTGTYCVGIESEVSCGRYLISVKVMTVRLSMSFSMSGLRAVLLTLTWVRGVLLLRVVSIVVLVMVVVIVGSLKCSVMC